MPKAAPLAERFWQNVEKQPGGCWLWVGLTDRRGYGRAWIGRGERTGASTVGAHRFAYEQLVGPIPVGLSLDHLCRIPACVNPEHLEPVSHAENCRRGSHVKLTQAQVDEIRASSLSARELAGRYGVAKDHIHDIRAGRKWPTGKAEEGGGDDVPTDS